MEEPYTDKMHTFFFLDNYGFLPTCAITQSNHAFPLATPRYEVLACVLSTWDGYSSFKPCVLRLTLFLVFIFLYLSITHSL